VKQRWEIDKDGNLKLWIEADGLVYCALIEPTMRCDLPRVAKSMQRAAKKSLAAMMVTGEKTPEAGMAKLKTMGVEALKRFRDMVDG
jgi:hypothetical protein